MKNFVIVIALLCACGLSFAAPGKDGNLTVSGNTTLNEYTLVTAISNGTNITITVDNINNLDDSQGIYTDADLSAGDRIMLYQAQGASYATAGDNTDSSGAYNLNSAGR